jgi:hypothetical protein
MHILGHETNNKFKEIETIQSVLFKHSGNKVSIGEKYQESISNFRNKKICFT